VGTELPSTVRTLMRVALDATDEGRLSLVLTGTGFLRHMVRAITGTAVEVGRGWRRADSMAELLSARQRAAAGATAPPHGLFLVSVDYD
jgi:tRNA pseudouridine38-40 synthase